eukprot:scaffold506375_cov22-Prasinocladus_malaysianus.AAC.1
MTLHRNACMLLILPARPNQTHPTRVAVRNIAIDTVQQRFFAPGCRGPSEAAGLIGAACSSGPAGGP